MKSFFSQKKNFSKKATGTLGEELACDYLKKIGYKIIEKNFRNPNGRQLGEIDIIAKKEGCLIFIEVKTRKGFSGQSILPESNITPSKLRKINKIASFYIKTNDLWETPYKFDALSIYLHPENNTATIKHLPDIFF